MKLIQGGLVKTITGGDIENGQILIDGGKIVAVGQNLDVPAGTEIIDAAGCIVTPWMSTTPEIVMTRQRRFERVTKRTTVGARDFPACFRRERPQHDRRDGHAAPTFSASSPARDRRASRRCGRRAAP